MRRFTALSSSLVLSLFVCGAAFADDDRVGAADSANNDDGGYSTDGTDRGGRASGQTPTDGTLDATYAELLAWLRGLRD